MLLDDGGTRWFLQCHPRGMLDSQESRMFWVWPDGAGASQRMDHVGPGCREASSPAA